MADDEGGWATVGGSKARKKKSEKTKNESTPRPSQQHHQKQPKQYSNPVQKQPQQQTKEQVASVSKLGAWGKGPQVPKSSTGVENVTKQLVKVRMDSKPTDSQSQKEGSKKSDQNKSPRDKVVTKFVPIPERTRPAPGRSVDLITNQIRIMIKEGLDIYQSQVNIDLVWCSAENSKPRGSKKLGNEFSCKLLSKALEKYLINNQPDLLKMPCPYVLDVRASMVLALFDISKDDKSKKSYDFEVEESKKDTKGNDIVYKYLVKLTQPKKILLHDNAMGEEYMRALNVILSSKYWSINKFFLPRSVSGNTSIFPYEENQHPIFDPRSKQSTGIFCNKGYIISARPAECGLVLNVANTIAPFYESCTLIAFLKKQYNVHVEKDKPLRKDIIDELKKELKMKQVYAEHINYGTVDKPSYKKYRIHDIRGSCYDKFRLVNKETQASEEISVIDYMKRDHKKHLNYPKLPCIIDNGRMVPFEFCRLVEKQRVARKMTSEETSQIVQMAAVPAIQHFEQVEKNKDEVCKLSIGPADAFGIKLDTTLIEVDGRELPPITMKARAGKLVETSRGEYKVYNMEFFKPTAQIKSWAVAFLTAFKRDLADKTRDSFSKAYCEAARKRGIEIKPVTSVDFLLENGRNVESMDESDLRVILGKYFDKCNQNKYDHVIFVLPKQCPEWVYGYLQYLEASVRRASAKEWSTRASCLKLWNFERKILSDQQRAPMFISNLWLKYNTKMGGTNFVLNIKSPDFVAKHFQPSYLYLAVDVCHPAPGDKLIQSVAAVVGMWDLTGPNGISYCTRVRVQKKEKENKSTIEHVLEIDKMFEEVLESYRKSKNSLPAHVVILRDGVSEGQFEIVLTKELRCLQNVLSSKVKVFKMSCFVVQKRHKIRFRRKIPIEGDYNIQPGTVVDHKVTHPTDHSFYLAPHKAIKGTARAAYIYMILDQIGFSQDEAQALIFSLSYLSPRCTKGTSIPTPVNLADRAAERGKNLVIAWNSVNKRKMEEEDRIRELNEFLAAIGDENYRHTLYYI